MLNQDRPYTICHMMSSLDGKIASGIEGVELFDNYFNLYTKAEDEISGQVYPPQKRAWMCGRATMKMFAGSDSVLPSRSEKEIKSEDFIVSSETGLFMVGVDTKGLLRWKGNTITLMNVDKPLSLVIAVLETTPQEYLQYLQELKISYLYAGKDVIDFAQLLSKLKSLFGIETVLIEGGGTLNGSLLAADLIDEMSLLLLPVAVNRSTATSVFDRQSESIDLKQFSLFEVYREDQDVVRLRYKRIPTTSV